jgi:hypothetical protein
MKTKNMARGVTNYERLNLISMIAQGQGLNVSSYVRDAVIAAVARDVHLQPYEIARFGIEGSDVFELINLVAGQNEMAVADYIKGSVNESIAGEMCMTCSQLEVVLEKVESWPPVLC